MGDLLEEGADGLVVVVDDLGLEVAVVVADVVGEVHAVVHALQEEDLEDEGQDGLEDDGLVAHLLLALELLHEGRLVLQQLLLPPLLQQRHLDPHQRGPEALHAPHLLLQALVDVLVQAQPAVALKFDEHVLVQLLHLPVLLELALQEAEEVLQALVHLELLVLLVQHHLLRPRRLAHPQQRDELREQKRQELHLQRVRLSYHQLLCTLIIPNPYLEPKT